MNADIFFSELISLFVSTVSRRLQFLGAVRAVNVSIASHKALVCQVKRALLTVKAVIVPRAALVVHYVRSLAKSCGMIYLSL